MFTEARIKEMTDAMWAEAHEKLAGVAEVQSGNVQSVLADMGTLNAKASSWRSAVEAVVSAVSCDGVFFPKFISKVITYGNEVTIRVSSKLNAAYKFKHEETLTVDENIIQSMGTVYATALVHMLHIEMAMENVDALNGVVADLMSEAESKLHLVFCCDGNKDTGVYAIDNETLVLNISVAAAHTVCKLGIMREGDDEYTALINSEARKEFIDAVKLAETTVHLVKTKTPVITELVKFSARKSAAKLIKRAFHRQAQYLGKQKAGVGYYDDNVEINGNKTHVFAAVEKTDDGELRLILNPFDTNTDFNVEYDVLAAVKASWK